MYASRVQEVEPAATAADRAPARAAATSARATSMARLEIQIPRVIKYLPLRGYYAFSIGCCHDMVRSEPDRSRNGSAMTISSVAVRRTTRLMRPSSAGIFHLHTWSGRALRCAHRRSSCFAAAKAAIQCVVLAACSAFGGRTARSQNVKF